MNPAMEVDAARIEQEGVPQTLAELMALALAMEREAAQRYAEFADAMEIHNNVEVAALFRKMATIETGHVQAIMTQMGWREAPAVASDAWLDAIEGPETPRGDEVHYLMQPWHALNIALACEQRAERFYERLAGMAEEPAVRDAALGRRPGSAALYRLTRGTSSDLTTPESHAGARSWRPVSQATARPRNCAPAPRRAAARSTPTRRRARSRRP